MRRPEKQMGRQEGEDIIANKLNNTTDALVLLCGLPGVPSLHRCKRNKLNNRATDGLVLSCGSAGAKPGVGPSFVYGMHF